MSTGRARRTDRQIVVEDGTIQGLRASGVAAAHEALARTGLLDPEIRPLQQGVVVAGVAVTVMTEPDDNLMIHAAVEHCSPGDVLVVAVKRESRHGLVGELLATALLAHGVAGLIIDGGVRDVGPIRQMGFPVWCRIVSARGTTKTSCGSLDQVVTCAGQEVRPGDIIVADDDGVVCVPQQQALEVAERCRARVTDEATKRQLLDQGVPSLDVFELRDSFERARGGD